MHSASNKCVLYGCLGKSCPVFPLLMQGVLALLIWIHVDDKRTKYIFSENKKLSFPYK